MLTAQQAGVLLPAVGTVLVLAPLTLLSPHEKVLD